jgi:hypothetical protein
MTDFAGLLRCLAEAGVEYVVVGGAAATAHGSARLTQDLDVVYRRTDDNLRRLATALAPHRQYLRGAPDGLPFRWDAQTLHRGLNFTLTTILGDLDLRARSRAVGGTRTSCPTPASSSCSASRAGYWGSRRSSA